MRAVQRWRYYCDFCKKAGQSGFHMKNHESVCTLNPVRVCKMCALLDGRSAADMTELLAVLPDPALHMVLTTYSRDELRLDDDAITPLIAAALPVLRELTHNCPVCILRSEEHTSELQSQS